MSESDRIERQRERNELLNNLLRTLGGILLLICTGLCGWAFTLISAHETRISVQESKQCATEERLKDIQGDLKTIIGRLPPRQ